MKTAFVIACAVSAFLGGYVLQSFWSAVILGAISGGLLGLLTIRRKDEKAIRQERGAEDVRSLPRQRGKRERPQR